MKRIWQHPQTPSSPEVAGWKSVGQLENSPQFKQWLEREFPEGADRLSEDEREMSRRSFVKLMGAASALAGLSMVSCRRAETHLVPYVQAPEWTIPGKPTSYASMYGHAFGAVPVMVTNHEGRPTKLEPNPGYQPRVGLDGFAQASILELYSPTRSRNVLVNGKPLSKQAGSEKEQLQALVKSWSELLQKGTPMAFLLGEKRSLLEEHLVNEISTRNPAAVFYRYEALSPANARAGWKNYFAADVELLADFSRLERIVSFDCDFLGLERFANTREFYAKRNPDGIEYDNFAKPDASQLNRLYVVESYYSVTGGMADHRLRMANAQLPMVMLALASEVARLTGSADLQALSRQKTAAASNEIPAEVLQEWVKACAADLVAAKGRSGVLLGSRHEASLHVLACAINQALGAFAAEKPAIAVLQSTFKALGGIDALVSDLRAKKFKAVAFLSPANPLFDSVHASELRTLLADPNLASLHVGERADATAHAVSLHIPAANYLECWGDAVTAEGHVGVTQPQILPLYNGTGVHELLFALLDAEGKLAGLENSEQAATLLYYKTRECLAKSFNWDKAGEEQLWNQTLQHGFVFELKDGKKQPVSLYKPATAVANSSGFAAVADKLEQLGKAPLAKTDSLNLEFSADYSILDGRFIDNAWLQEAPDPISKLTWDNVAYVSAKTAKNLGIYQQIVELESWNAGQGADAEAVHRSTPMIKLELNGKQLHIPVMVSFGIAENTLVLPIGYGQGVSEDDVFGRSAKLYPASHVGYVGINTGFDVGPLRSANSPWFAQGAKVATSQLKYPVALTQEHNSMYGRALVREVSVDDFNHDPSGAKMQGDDSHIPPNISLYKQEGSNTWHPKEGWDKNKPLPLLSDKNHQWAMAIDLASCIGCNACQMACQAENNIPVVGKRQVAMGREMQWIRMDRYFAAELYERGKDGKAALKLESAKPAPDWIKDNPEMLSQPVACLQCESAPCETVCPVNATVHSEDGLNTMAYNRCIGTRYCANNCPYKARRFNYFDYNKRNPLLPNNLYMGPFGETKVGDAPHLQRNPNVTVRMRGVMEKCTYCTQRIQAAKIRQKRNQKFAVQNSGEVSPNVEIAMEDMRVQADTLQTACQAACPAGAISFGNLLDKQQARVYRAHQSSRSYALLKYIGTNPRTLFLARVKNPNPSMPDAHYVGNATIDMI